VRLANHHGSPDPRLAAPGQPQRSSLARRRQRLDDRAPCSDRHGKVALRSQKSRQASGNKAFAPRFSPPLLPHACWLIGLDRRERRDRIVEFLLASELTYAGHGYCVALARLATARGGRTTRCLPGYLRATARQAERPGLGTRRLGVSRPGAQRPARCPFPDRRRALAAVEQNTETSAELHEWIDQLCSVADECMRAG
jgi:hypothetical protein